MAQTSPLRGEEKTWIKKPMTIVEGIDESCDNSVSMYHESARKFSEPQPEPQRPKEIDPKTFLNRESRSEFVQEAKKKEEQRRDMIEKLLLKKKELSRQLNAGRTPELDNKPKTPAKEGHKNGEDRPRESHGGSKDGSEIAVNNETE
jgi:hypothetical protein